jgi:hypothetical protein
VSALLRALPALIGALVAAGLALLAALLLLLAIAVRLRSFFILLVGVVSHFPSPFAAHELRRGIRPTRCCDRCCVAIVGAWPMRDGPRRIQATGARLIGSFDD